MPQKFRKLTSINPDGTGWVEGEGGMGIPVQLVMGRGGALGVVTIDGQDALGLDQLGPQQPPPPPMPSAAPRKADDHFDVSGLDQS